MPQSFAPTIELIRRHSQAGAVVATFTNAGAAKFALNWARQLQSVGLKSVVGLSQRLGAELENELRAAGAGLFCADGEHMQINGQENDGPLRKNARCNRLIISGGRVVTPPQWPALRS